jgi:mannose-6-phosphate isomerase-like protein (cupin superfamily)
MATMTPPSTGDGTQVKTFEVSPQHLDTGKKVNLLVREGAVTFGLQVVATGGETNLHNHPNSDAIWLVLGGEATFYGEGDKVLGKIGKNQGLFIPHGQPYWFESSTPDKDNLVILRFGARVDPANPDSRVDVSGNLPSFN